MSARIRHLALYTENQTGMANFYKTVFGMKRITESFNQPNHGHISDGVIGLAVLRRRPGFHSALDHFGFEVDDVGVILERLKEKYPKVLVTKGLEQVAFAVFRSHDPAGTQFDISWKQHPKVQEGYKDDGWKQAEADQSYRDPICGARTRCRVLSRSVRSQGRKKFLR
jgi:catechol 2,3-dioxygenase-like lactoylglutathione lyase family enzyme